MLPPTLLDEISSSICDIRHIDVSACSLTITDIEQIQAALANNNSVRTISWPQNLVDNPRILKIEEDLTKKFGPPLGSKYAHEYFQPLGPARSGTKFFEYGMPIFFREILCFHEIVEALAADPDSADLRAAEDAFTEFGLSYKELNAKANQLAHYLIQRKSAIATDNNNRKETIVAVFINRSVDYLITILAIMKSGCAFFSLDTNPEIMPEQRIKQCCNAVKPAIVISQSRLEPRIKPILSDVPTVVLDKIDTSSFSTNNIDYRVYPTDLAYIVFSSGSEAEPKGIKIEHKGIKNIILASREAFELTPKDNVAQFASLAFDASLYEIFIALGSRARVTFVPDEVRSDPAALENFYNLKNITIAVFVSSLLLILKPENFKTLRIVLSTGEAAYKESIKLWEDQKKARFDGYGPSEVTIGTTIVACQEQMHIGKSFLGLRTYLLEIVDDEDCEHSKRKIITKIDQEGELCIAGTGVARGYVSKELTKKAFIKDERLGDIYLTGDRVKFDKDGNMHYLGRIREEFKLDGKLVSLLEIEQTLSNHAEKPESAIKEICVVKHTKVNKQLGINMHKIIVHVTPKEGRPIDTIDLYQFLALQKPRYMWPAHWVIRKTDLPRTGTSKKIDRKLVAQEKENIELVRFKPFKAPNVDNAIEYYLYKEMKACLDLEIDFSIYDNFFDLGGTSLLFLSFLARLKARYKSHDYPKFHLAGMQDLAANPTVASLARRIKSEKTDFDPLVAMIPNGENIPVYCIHSVLGNPEDTYLEFAKRVLPNRIVYGFRAHALIDSFFTPDTIQEFARDYVKRIIQLREAKNYSGPIVLLGLSTGGTIAFEMTRILLSYNFKVITFIVDSISPITLQTMPSVPFVELCVEMLKRLRGQWGDRDKLLNQQTVDIDAAKEKALYEEVGRSAANNNNRKNLSSLFQGFERLLQEKSYDQNIDEFKFITSLVNTEMHHIQKPLYLNPGSKIFVLRSKKSTELYVQDKKLGWGDNVITTDHGVDSNHFDILKHIDSNFVQNILIEVDNKLLYTWKLPSIAKDFIIRPALVNQIQLELNREKSNPQSVIVLYGHSGVGKSQLAGYILTVATNFTIRAWFNAGSYDQLAWECLEFGKKQNITLITLDNACEKVRVWLSKNQDFLVVYDNFDFNDSQLLKSLPTDGNIIITSNVPCAKYSNFEVRNMEEREAAKLVEATLGCDGATPELAKILKCHPLSLSIACAFIRENKDKVTIAKYIEKIKQFNYGEKPALLELVCKITMSYLIQHDNGVAEFIRKCSFLNGSYLPSLILKVLVDSYDHIEREYTLKEIIEQLRRFAIIRDVDQEGVSFHKGLQELIRVGVDVPSPSKKQAENPVLDRLSYLLVTNYPFEKATPKHYVFAQELKSHIESLLPFAQPATLGKARLLRILADIYSTLGFFGRQIIILQELRWLHATLNQKHSDAVRERALTNVALVKSHFSIAVQMMHLHLLHEAIDSLSRLPWHESITREILKIHAYIIYLCRENNSRAPVASQQFVTEFLEHNKIDSFELASVQMCAVLNTRRDQYLKQSIQLLQRYSLHHPALISCYQALAQECEARGQEWLVAAVKEQLELALEVKRKNIAVAYFSFDQLAVYTRLFAICCKINDSTGIVERMLLKLPEMLSLFHGDLTNLKAAFILLKKQSLRDPVYLQWFSLYNFRRANRSGTDLNSISEYNSELRQLVNLVVSDCVQILGEPPCSFVVLGLGSTGYGMALDNSDYEFGIALTNNIKAGVRSFIDAYFICFIRLFKFLLKTAFEPYKLHIDYNLSPKVSNNRIDGLYGPVDEIILNYAKLEREKKNNKMTYTPFYALLTHTCLYSYEFGDENVYQDFQRALANCLLKTHNDLSFHKAYALQQFSYHHRQFNSTQQKDRKYVAPIKNLYFRPLIFTILDLSLFNNLLQSPLGWDAFNLFKQIKLLQDKKVIGERFAAALAASLDTVMCIRSAAHKHIQRYVTTELVRQYNVSDRDAQEGIVQFHALSEDEIPNTITSKELYQLTRQDSRELSFVLRLLQNYQLKILADLGTSNSTAKLPLEYDPIPAGLYQNLEPVVLPTLDPAVSEPLSEASSNLLAIINQEPATEGSPSSDTDRTAISDIQWLFSSPAVPTFKQPINRGEFDKRYDQIPQLEVQEDEPEIFMMPDEYECYQLFELSRAHTLYRECVASSKKVLNLSTCYLSSDELEMLIDYNLLNDQSITTIILPKCIMDDSASSLTDLLAKNYHIIKVDFNKANFSDENIETIQFYLERNRVYTRIERALATKAKVLDLRNQSLGEAGALFLAQQLRKTRGGLEAIYLSGNAIGNNAAKKVHLHAAGIKLHWGTNNNISAKISKEHNSSDRSKSFPENNSNNKEPKKIGEQKLAIEYNPIRGKKTLEVASPVNQLGQRYFGASWNRHTGVTSFSKSAFRWSEDRQDSGGLNGPCDGSLSPKPVLSQPAFSVGRFSMWTETRDRVSDVDRLSAYAQTVRRNFNATNNIDLHDRYPREERFLGVSNNHLEELMKIFSEYDKRLSNGSTLKVRRRAIQDSTLLEAVGYSIYMAIQNPKLRAVVLSIFFMTPFFYLLLPEEAQLYIEYLIFFILAATEFHKTMSRLAENNLANSVWNFITPTLLNLSSDVVNNIRKKFSRVQQSSENFSRLSFHQPQNDKYQLHERRPTRSNIHKQAKR